VQSSMLWYSKGEDVQGRSVSRSDISSHVSHSSHSSHSPSCHTTSASSHSSCHSSSRQTPPPYLICAVTVLTPCHATLFRICQMLPTCHPLCISKPFSLMSHLSLVGRHSSHSSCIAQTPPPCHSLRVSELFSLMYVTLLIGCTSLFPCHSAHVTLIAHLPPPQGQ
jgi:hypothetical protein